MQRIIFAALVVALSSTSANAQFAVIDHGNLAQTVLIAERTLREYEALMAQYETLVRMSRGLGNMERYRVPTVANAEHDIERWEYARSWLQGLNSGDPDGSRYRTATRRLENPTYALQQIPPTSRRAVPSPSTGNRRNRISPPSPSPASIS